MNLTEWLHYLGTIHPKEIELGLTRITDVAIKLGITSFSCPIVTVAGTNGKGSCVATLDAIARQAGYTVATYTSPHLLCFNERIQIAGKPVADELICQAFAHIEAIRHKTRLTFFEFVTLAALWIFQQYTLDFIILEVGLGGRLDAVNIIDADIAVLTTIALDHTDRLGNTREQIGFEKAGILRQSKQAVCGDYSPPNTIQTVAENLSVDLYNIGCDFTYAVTGNTWQWQNKQVTYTDLPISKLALQNVASALQVISLLKERLPISLLAIKNALNQLALPGRFYRIQDRREIILDVAHNPAGGVWLAQQLKQQPGRIVAVVGMLADKDQLGTLAPLVSIVQQWFIAGLAVPRGGTVEMLAENLTKLGVKHLQPCQTVVQAYQTAQLQAEQGDTILVFGSFHTVGEILSDIKGRQ